VRDRSLLLGSLIVVLAASGFGLLGPLARFAYDAGFDPLSFVAWRAAFGLLCVLVVVAARRWRGVGVVNPLHLPRADRLGLVVIAASAIGLNVAMFFAFDLTTVAVALLAFYTYPAFVAIVAVALGHERLDGARLAALGLALVGMVLVVAGGLTAGGPVTIHPVGVLLGLVAAAWQTVFVTVSRGRFATVPAEQAMAWAIGATAIVCALATLATGGPLGVVFQDPVALGIAAFTGIAAAGIPSILFLVGIRTIGGTRAGILMLFEPLVGVTLAAALLDEALTPIQVGGGVAILAAAILLQRGAPAGERMEPAAVPSVEHG
jgi:drug/metabolite transporter (DMT)-like permease